MRKRAMVSGRTPLCRAARVAGCLAAVAVIASCTGLAADVFSLGNNAYGQLGIGQEPPHEILVPQAIGGLAGVSAVGAGHTHSLVVLNDGRLYAFGGNFLGQLGLGDTENRYYPTEVTAITGAVAAVGGWGHTLILLGDGTVYSCGWSYSGELGLGDTADRHVPTRVTSLSGVTAVAAGGGGSHSLFLMDNGDVYACGLNNWGQLGLGDYGNRSVPTKVPNIAGAVAIAADGLHSLVLLGNGDVYACGANDLGQLGSGNTLPRATFQKITSISGAEKIAAGSGYSLVVLRDGTLLSFGNNEFGQLGLGDQLNRFEPTRVDLDDVKDVAAGVFYSLAIAGNGDVYFFGDNLSSFSDEHFLVPTAVDLGSNHTLGGVTAAIGSFHLLIMATVVNQVPTCNFTWTPATPAPGQVVTFVGTASDPDGTVSSFKWYWPDDTFTTGATSTFTFSAAGSYLVTLEATDNRGASVYKETWITVSERSIQVLAPNGGEVWEVGSSKEIKWASIGAGTTVRLDYSTDSGTSWLAITTSTANDSSFMWPVPNQPSQHCRVRVSSSSPALVDASDGDFAIVTPQNQAPDTKITEFTLHDQTATVSFKWTGSDDHTPTSGLKYEYRLIGSTQWASWSSASTSTSWTSPKLGDGNYRFEVHAIDSEGAVDPSPASREFSISKPVTDTDLAILDVQPVQSLFADSDGKNGLDVDLYLDGHMDLIAGKPLVVLIFVDGTGVDEIPSSTPIMVKVTWHRSGYDHDAWISFTREEFSDAVKKKASGENYLVVEEDVVTSTAFENATLSVTVDPDHLIAETNENNNSLSFPWPLEVVDTIGLKLKYYDVRSWIDGQHITADGGATSEIADSFMKACFPLDPGEYEAEFSDSPVEASIAGWVDTLASLAIRGAAQGVRAAIGFVSVGYEPKREWSGAHFGQGILVEVGRPAVVAHEVGHALGLYTRDVWGGGCGTGGFVSAEDYSINPNGEPAGRGYWVGLDALQETGALANARALRGPSSCDAFMFEADWVDTAWIDNVVNPDTEPVTITREAALLAFPCTYAAQVLPVDYDVQDYLELMRALGAPTKHQQSLQTRAQAETVPGPALFVTGIVRDDNTVRLLSWRKLALAEIPAASTDGQYVAELRDETGAIVHSVRFQPTLPGFLGSAQPDLEGRLFVLAMPVDDQASSLRIRDSAGSLLPIVGGMWFSGHGESSAEVFIPVKLFSDALLHLPREAFEGNADEQREKLGNLAARLDHQLAEGDSAAARETLLELETLLGATISPSFSQPDDFDYAPADLAEAVEIGKAIVDARPLVQVLTPAAGDLVSGRSVELRWEASDPDDIASDLSITLEYSSNGGASWVAIAEGETNDGGYTWRADVVPCGDCDIRVTATDPLGLSASFVTGPFTLCAQLSELRPAPNPIRESGTAFFYVLPLGTQSAELLIFAVDGRLLLEIPLDVLGDRFPAGGTWNPADSSGLPLANGPYICELVVDGRVRVTVKVVIQR